MLVYQNRHDYSFFKTSRAWHLLLKPVTPSISHHMTLPLLRGWSTFECGEVVLFEVRNCAGRHKDVLWRVWNQSTVSFCQRSTGRAVYLELELLPRSFLNFRADKWVMFFTMSAWLRNTSPACSGIRGPQPHLFMSLSFLDFCTFAMYFNRKPLTLWQFQLAQSRAACALRNTCCCKRIRSILLTLKWLLNRQQMKF